LTEIYSCGDILLNFSTLWGEDYGLSVAEALVTGLPCLLTEWMGLKDYKSVGENLVSSFQVKYENNQYCLNTEEIFAALKHLMTLPRQDRKVLAKTMKQKLGKESFLAQLEAAKNSKKIKINQKLVNLWFNQDLTTRKTMALNKMQNEL
jgi:glycosyltransferase involved in cell wall biosynthesis